MKITISKKERLTFTPEIEDKAKTEEARKAAPPEERSKVEPILVLADYSLHFWPLTLSEEEDVMSAIQTAPKDADGNVRPHPSMVNGLIAKKLCGWSGVYEDDKGTVPFTFNPDWEGKVPGEVIQAFDPVVRAAAFSFLLQQAGMGAETSVGKPE